MFGAFFKRKGDVLDHWYTLIDGFNMSGREIYSLVEDRLKELRVPGLEIHYVDFFEGGILSAKREYLRMSRERLVFDICAAPFGQAYFFSCHFVEIPAKVEAWRIIAALIAIYLLANVLIQAAGYILGFFFLLMGFGILVYLLRNAVSLGLRDLDAAFIKMPIWGPVYEAWFRKDDTYYRHDTRLLYLETINKVVKQRVEEVTGSQGIKLIRFNDSSKILGELYKPTIILPRPPPEN
jgi:hypothetical protein